ncbi:trypsin-like peptidase domain-containing protein [Candidatus Sumerlaeota bacterium]|nr:trypsin-like peptidase domain-containing protein [Candidatus Sumerlaeota bacterium]
MRVSTRMRMFDRVFLILVVLAAFAAGRFWPREASEAPSLDRSAVAAAVESALPPPLDDLDDRRCSDLVCAANAVVPAIVSISVERTAYVRVGSPFAGDFFGMFDPFTVVEKQEQKMPYLGSGIVVDSKGVVVTNCHVVEGANRLFVTLSDGKEYEADLLGADKISDIAVLKARTSDSIPSVNLGDSDDVRLGEWVLAIGNPYGALLEDPSPTVTAGVVSARNRFFYSTGDKPRLYEGMIQTDASINPGNSGGALVNVNGEVIGVNTFIVSGSGGSIGLGFAIPINRVKRILDEIERYGRVRDVRRDLELRAITPYVQRVLSLASREGVLVFRVEGNSAAQAAGIEPGDVIRSVNGRPANGPREFWVLLLGHSVGDKIEIVFQRRDKAYKTHYVIQAQAEAPGR